MWFDRAWSCNCACLTLSTRHEHRFQGFFAHECGISISGSSGRGGRVSGHSSATHGVSFRPMVECDRGGLSNHVAPSVAGAGRRRSASRERRGTKGWRSERGQTVVSGSGGASSHSGTRRGRLSSHRRDQLAGGERAKRSTVSRCHDANSGWTTRIVSRGASGSCALSATGRPLVCGRRRLGVGCLGIGRRRVLRGVVRSRPLVRAVPFGSIRCYRHTNFGSWYAMAWTKRGSWTNRTTTYRSSHQLTARTSRNYGSQNARSANTAASAHRTRRCKTRSTPEANEIDWGK